ncbi:hypothetical protein GO755_01305 [Spirosoma sp. HMF4905]|uniref:Uncharacterized protein n=1 Tax=Spirosoma arboris TaxID=2682092 RepID=A0A7K1S4C0_9BACT|nr:hypothetical protein [Spirosoma arboris]MVM28650.1 hypothetical protein [Spirosoma arboris]
MEIISLIVAIITGLPAIIAWLKSTTPRIYLVIDSDINLYQQIVRNVNGLTINYEGALVGKSTRLVKGFVFYKGKEDITDERIKSPLRLQFTEKTKIYDCKILGLSEALKVDITILDNAIEFNFDLLKDEEYFYFETFFEPETDESKYTLINRISNIPKSIPTLNYFDITWRNETSNFPVFMLFMLGGFMLFDTSKFPHNEKYELHISKENFVKNVYYKGSLVNTDSINKATDSLDKLYQTNVTKIFKKYPVSKINESAKTVIGELNQNMINYYNGYATNENFFVAYRKSDTLLNTILYSKDIILSNFLILFKEMGPYKLNDEYSVKYDYVYKIRIYLAIIGIILYLVGTYFMFRYFRTALKYRFIIKKIRLLRSSVIERKTIT